MSIESGAHLQTVGINRVGGMTSDAVDVAATADDAALKTSMEARTEQAGEKYAEIKQQNPDHPNPVQELTTGDKLLLSVVASENTDTMNKALDDYTGTAAYLQNLGGRVLTQAKASTSKVATEAKTVVSTAQGKTKKERILEKGKGLMTKMGNKSEEIHLKDRTMDAVCVVQALSSNAAIMQVQVINNMIDLAAGVKSLKELNGLKNKLEGSLTIVEKEKGEHLGKIDKKISATSDFLKDVEGELKKDPNNKELGEMHKTLNQIIDKETKKKEATTIEYDNKISTLQTWVEQLSHSSAMRENAEKMILAATNFGASATTTSSGIGGLARASNVVSRGLGVAGGAALVLTGVTTVAFSLKHFDSALDEFMRGGALKNEAAAIRVSGKAITSPSNPETKHLSSEQKQISEGRANAVGDMVEQFAHFRKEKAKHDMRGAAIDIAAGASGVLLGAAGIALLFAPATMGVSTAVTVAGVGVAAGTAVAKYAEGKYYESRVNELINDPHASPIVVEMALLKIVNDKSPEMAPMREKVIDALVTYYQLDDLEITKKTVGDDNKLHKVKDAKGHSIKVKVADTTDKKGAIIEAHLLKNLISYKKDFGESKWNEAYHVVFLGDIIPEVKTPAPPLPEIENDTVQSPSHSSSQSLSDEQIIAKHMNTQPNLIAV